MTDGLLAQLEEAKLMVQALELAVRQAACSEVGHDWKFKGGTNAGCHELCSCSASVYYCTKCGDCDYGNNPETEQLINDCDERKELEYQDECDRKLRESAGDTD